jgi:hypothetical protein
VLRALADFIVQSRARAADEAKAGRLVVASDFSVFADEANDLLARGSVTAGSTPANTSQTAAAPKPVPDTPMPPQPMALKTGAPVQALPTADTRVYSQPLPPVEQPSPSFVSVTQLLTPDGGLATADAAGVQQITNVPSPAPPPPAPAERAAPGAQDRSVPEFYAARGDAMMAVKDVSAARKFYQYAANAGSARAAAALARTYDAAFITAIGAVGLKPDPALVSFWQRRAAELGEVDDHARGSTQSAEAAR